MVLDDTMGRAQEIGLDCAAHYFASRSGAVHGVLSGLRATVAHLGAVVASTHLVDHATADEEMFI